MISSGEIWRREMQQMKIERAIEILEPACHKITDAMDTAMSLWITLTMVVMARKMQHGGMRR